MMKCYFCNEDIKEGEKTAEITSQIGEWKSDPHTICNACALGIVEDTEEDKE